MPLAATAGIVTICVFLLPSSLKVDLYVSLNQFLLLWCICKRKTIAASVDALGAAAFRPASALRASAGSWLAYINKTYAAGQTRQGPSVGKGKSIYDDE
jgi:hypothetical protein